MRIDSASEISERKVGCNLERGLLPIYIHVNFFSLFLCVELPLCLCQAFNLKSV
jgi:hypothetical protein